MNDQTHPDQTCSAPDEHCWLPDDCRLPNPPVPVPAFVVRSTIETLTWLDEFLRCHAGPAVLAELDAFCRAQGAGGGGSANFVIDAVGLDLRGLQRAAHATADEREQR